MTGQEARLEANHNGGGVHGPAFKPLQTWEGLRKKAKVSNRTREIWPSGIMGGFGNRQPWWGCESVLQSKEQERKPPTYSRARPISIPIPPVRFDERGRETERCRMAQATAPFLDSTCTPRARVTSGGRSHPE